MGWDLPEDVRQHGRDMLCGPQPSAAACLDDVLDCPTLLARGDAAARQIMEKYPLFMREFGPTHR